MNRFNIMIPTAATALLALGMFSAGCSQGPSTAESIVHPKVGSGYTYTRSDLDSAGRPVPGTDTTVTATVVAADTAIYGKTEVQKILESNNFWYLHYEPNGDVSMCFDWKNNGPFAPRWVILPFASGIPQNTVLADTTLQVANDHTIDTVKIKFVAEVKKTGVDTVVIGSQKLLSEKVQLTIRTSDNGTSNTTTLDLEFAPKVGFFSRKDDGFVDQVTGKHGTRMQMLKSFTLK
ncbi:MAG: hypothetical protein JWQ98_1189 [Chlorobi bacterium]|nr:hypothetical protein [Chlorobiota bacterium]